MERRNLCLLNSSGITNWRGKWCLSSLEVRGQRNCLKEKGNTEAHVIQINRALHVTPREKKGLKKKKGIKAMLFLWAPPQHTAGNAHKRLFPFRPVHPALAPAWPILNSSRVAAHRFAACWHEGQARNAGTAHPQPHSVHRKSLQLSAKI